jgi:uncharacterized protein YbgA (DUF1722 family)/uncharacterized protein YbbK (DUF523 family)
VRANAAAGSAPERPRLGVSACLLGHLVRFDGQHKRDGFLCDQLGGFVQWVPVCPEAEVGMGTPRESVRLLRRSDGGISLLGSRSGHDWTAPMSAFVQRRVAGLANERLSGFVLKRSSPTCGMARVRVCHESGDGARAQHDGVGVFAAELARQLPDLPVEEEGRLTDARLRERFVERVFAYHRLQGLWARAWTMGDLVTFHTAEKMALLAHSTDGYRALGRLVANAKRLPRPRLQTQYQAAFMQTLAIPTTSGRQANVLMHMLGHISQRMDARDRHEVLSIIDDHRRGFVPLVVPIALVRHHVERLAITYLRGQSYLAPHPKELMLRNHV